MDIRIVKTDKQYQEYLNEVGRLAAEDPDPASAGGHLVAAVNAHFADRTYTPVDAADKLSCRPDFTLPSTLATCGRTRTTTRPLAMRRI